MTTEKTKRRANGTYGTDFACENCGATDKGPYRQGQCNTCYCRQYMRSKARTPDELAPSNDQPLHFRQNKR